MGCVIRTKGLGKLYQIEKLRDAHHRSLREDLTVLFGGKKKRGAREKDFWALRGIDLKIEQGESVALVGSNGSGKSTLLKILARVAWPTEGEFTIKGKIGALLEVGTGFHPDLTGRENVFLCGAILGMSRSDVEAHFDEIVSFSEIEEFLDTPVKRYSSGMYLRLAFSVMLFLRSDILMIDEVLAVGDASFQKKCVAKMHDAITQGKTTIFVSHDREKVKELCSRAILLDHGSVIADGPVDEVLPQYEEKVLIEV